MARRSQVSPFITRDTSVLQQPLDAFKQILAAQTDMPKPSQTPEVLLQDIDWEQCIDIRDFGAVVNGVSDDSDAIRAAIAFAQSENTLATGVICLPAGSIGIGSPISVPTGIYFRGAGQGLTVVKALASMTSMFYPENAAPGGGVESITAGFVDMSLDCNSLAARGLGPLAAFGDSGEAVFNTLWMFNFTVANATSVGIVMNTNNTITGALRGFGVRVTGCISAGILLVTGNVLLEDFSASGNSGPSIRILSMNPDSRITGVSQDSVFISIDNDLGTGGTGLAQGGYFNLVHGGQGNTLDVNDTNSGLRNCLIHILTTSTTRTLPVLDWSQASGSPNAIRGNFVTVGMAAGSTGPVVAYGTQVGNNTFNVVHHFAPDSTAPKYTGTIGNNSTNVDLYNLGVGGAFPSSGGNIRENGVDQTSRLWLNFVDTSAGAGLIVDDAGNNEVEVHLDLYVLLAGRTTGQAIIGGTITGTFLDFEGNSVDQASVVRFKQDTTTGDTGTADAAVSTTTGPPGTLTDTREAWTVNQWAGHIVRCNNKSMLIASNTATTVTGTGAWSGGGNPGNGNAWSISQQATRWMVGSEVNARLQIGYDPTGIPQVEFGPGVGSNAHPDVGLKRPAANVLSLIALGLTTSSPTLRSQAFNDTQPRWEITGGSSGRIGWGPGGTTAIDTFLQRIAANVIAPGTSITSGAQPALEMRSPNVPGDVPAPSIFGVRLYANTFANKSRLFTRNEEGTITGPLGFPEGVLGVAPLVALGGFAINSDNLPLANGWGTLDSATVFFSGVATTTMNAGLGMQQLLLATGAAAGDEAGLDWPFHTQVNGSPLFQAHIGINAITDIRAFIGYSSLSRTKMVSADSPVGDSGSGPAGDNGTADAAVTTTTGPPGTLTDTRIAWAVNQWAGYQVSCNNKTMIIASNTATTLTGTGGWSGGGNPGNGNAWVILQAPTTLVDATKAWTVNEWVGCQVVVGVNVLVITSNTATVLTGTAGWKPSPPGASQAYVIPAEYVGFRFSDSGGGGPDTTWRLVAKESGGALTNVDTTVAPLAGTGAPQILQLIVDVVNGFSATIFGQTRVPSAATVTTVVINGPQATTYLRPIIAIETRTAALKTLAIQAGQEAIRGPIS